MKFLTLSLLSQQLISNCLNSRTFLSFLKLLGKLFKLLLNIHINVYHLYLPSKLEDHGLVPGPFVIPTKVFFFTFAAARPILQGSLLQSYYLVFLKLGCKSLVVYRAYLDTLRAVAKSNALLEFSWTFSYPKSFEFAYCLGRFDLRFVLNLPNILFLIGTSRLPHLSIVCPGRDGHPQENDNILVVDRTGCWEPIQQMIEVLNCK